MASENARAVGLEAVEIIGKNRKLVKGKLLKKHGYKDSTAKTPQIVFNTKSCKEVTNKIITGIDLEIEKIKTELASRVISKEKYNELVKALDILIKNYQLLSGGATDRKEEKFNEDDFASLMESYEENKSRKQEETN